MPIGAPKPIRPPIGSETAPVAHSEEYVEDKASKYDLALGDSSPGFEAVLTNLKNTNVETQARLVEEQDKLKTRKEKAQLIADLSMELKSQGKPLDQQTFDFILNLSASDLEERRTNPKWGANDAYAKHVANLGSRDPYLWQKFFLTKEDEETYHKVRDIAEGHIAWREDVYDVVNDLEAEMGGKSIPGTIYEYGEQWLVPFASYFNKRSTVRSDNVGSIFLGNNLEEQYRYLNTLPLEQRRQVFSEAVREIKEDNLLDAIEFARGALEYSRNAAVVDNVFTGLEIATTLPVGTIGKAGKAVKGVKGAKAVKGVKGAKAVAKQDNVLDLMIKGGLDEKVADDVMPEGIRLAAKKIAGEVKSARDVKEAPQAPAKALDPLRVSLNGTSVKSTEATADHIKLVENKLAKEYERLDKLPRNRKYREAENELANYYRSWLQEASSQSASKDSRALANGEEISSRIAMRDLAEASDPTNPNLASDVLAATGRSQEASAYKAAKLNEIEKMPEPPSTTRGRVELESLVPTAMSPQASKVPGQRITKITNALATRINDVMKRVDSVLNDAIKGSSSMATRFSSKEMYDKALAVAKADYEKMYPDTNDAILDVSFNIPDDSLTNTFDLYTFLGTAEKTLFAARSHAWNAATKIYNLKKGSFDIVQFGQEFAIRIKTVADETKLNDLLIPTDGSNTTPTGIANTFLGYFRTTNDLVSKTNMLNRNAVTHGYSALQSQIAEVGDLIAKVKRIPGAMNRFERVLRAGLHETREIKVNRRNRLTGKMEEKIEKQPGVEWDMAGFERKYMLLNGGRMPSETEVLAYEVYKRLNNFDYTLRNLDLYRDTARLGVSDWRFKAWVPDVEGAEQLGWTMDFHAKQVDELPYDSEIPAKFAIYDETGRAGMIENVRGASPEIREYVKGLKEQGYRILQVHAPDLKPLQDVLKYDGVVNFVLVKEAQSSPLKLQMIPKKYGGHRIPDEPFFIKQPRLKQASKKVKKSDGSYEDVLENEKVYEGDITVAGVHSEAKAREMIPLLEQARQLYLKGNLGDFNKLVAGSLGRDPKRLWDDFKEGVLNPDETFYTVKTGQGVNDTQAFKEYVKNIPNFVDSIDSPYNTMRQVNKKFAGLKSPDLFSYEKIGDGEGNPVFKFKTATYIDPIEAMTTSMSTLMKNRAFSDYVTHSVTSWVEEFGDLLNVNIDQLRNNPLHYLHNPQWIDKPVQRDRLAAAKNARAAVMNLIGTRSDLQNNIEWVKSKVVDAVYTSLGDRASAKVADWLLPGVSDPVAYIRATAFHLKLGLFNPVQIWAQGQTFFHMTAVTGNPLRAGQAFVGGHYMQAALHTENEAIIKHIANLAAKTGWGSADEFMESFNALKSTGLHKIEGEHGWVDSTLDPQVFKGVFSKFLDKGTIFFKGIEKNIRLGSWNIAYKEWKKANPGKALTKKEDIRAVLNRQNDLSLNMTSANSAALQKGVFSVPTQFFGYQMRILDQMLGKRLTAAEKARVFGMYSMVYGVPIGSTMGMTAPWYEDIISAAEQNGVKFDEGAGQLFFQGALSFLTEAAFGDELNPARRYGPGGFEFIKNLIDNDFGQDGLVTLAGASTGIFMDAARWMQPALTTLWSQTMDSEDEQLPLEPQDFIDAFRSITTVNNGVKAYMALNYSAYFTRDGAKILEADETDAVAIALFGLTPSSIEKMYRQMDFIKEDREAMDSLKKEYIKNVRRSLRAESPSDRALYMKRARIIAQSARLDTKEKGVWLRQALKDDEMLVHKMDKEFLKLIEKRK